MHDLNLDLLSPVGLSSLFQAQHFRTRPSLFLGHLTFLALSFVIVQQALLSEFLTICKTTLEAALAEVIGQRVINVVHADDSNVIAIRFELCL